MNIRELEQKFDYYKVPKSWYCIGGEAQYAYCLNYEKGKWILFTLERGEHSIIEEFDTEDVACEKLYKLLMGRLERRKGRMNKTK